MFTNESARRVRVRRFIPSVILTLGWTVSLAAASLLSFFTLTVHTQHKEVSLQSLI